MDFVEGGGTTFKLPDAKKGIEADECFWFAKAHRLAGIDRIDLTRDPPPELAIDVDVSRQSISRFPIYRGFGVAEIWRLEGNMAEIYLLPTSGDYALSENSRLFPIVRAVDLAEFMEKSRTNGVISALGEFRQWFRAKLSEK